MGQARESVQRYVLILAPFGDGNIFMLWFGQTTLFFIYSFTTAWAKGGGKECFCLGAFIGGLGMP